MRVRGARPGLCRPVLLVGMAIACSVITGPGTESGAQTTVPPYMATAASDGVKLVVEVPGAPLSDTVAEGGGPTAQAQADSGGTSRAYAAFPDPGEMVISAPGLVTGLLAASGVELPTLPNYPFYVSSDGVSEPSEEFGDGPYSVRAESGTLSTTADAVAGLEATVAGNAALASAHASIRVEGSTVVSSASSNLEGLTIGPLTIGRIRTSATMTLDDGEITPSTDVAIEGVRIGGLAVALDAESLMVGDTPVPLPLGDVLAGILRSSGMTVEIVPGHVSEDRVFAPAVRVTVPFSDGGLGAGSGTAVLTVGRTLASMEGSAPLPPSDSPIGGSAPVPTGTGNVSQAGPALPDGSPSSGAPSSVPPPDQARPHAQPPVSIASDPVVRSSIQDRFDIRTVYLLVVIGAVLTVASSSAIRTRGVHRPWSSITG